MPALRSHRAQSALDAQLSEQLCACSAFVGLQHDYGVCGRGGMVDAGDLKSLEFCSCGFESRRPHQWACSSVVRAGRS